MVKALSFSIVIHFVYNFTTTRFRFLRDIEDMIGRMNIVARIYFMSMWYAGTPAMILFIIIYAFIGYDTIAANYAGSYGTVLVGGIEVIASNLIYPDWTNVIGKSLTVTPYFKSKVTVTRLKSVTLRHLVAKDFFDRIDFFNFFIDLTQNH